MDRLGILLIAHGSRQAEANEDLHHMAKALQNEGYNITVASFLELAEPDILTGGRQCVTQGAERVLLVPYFLSAGVHVQRDLTEAREKLSQEFPDVEFRLAEPIGRHPALIQIMTDRINESLKTTE